MTEEQKFELAQAIATAASFFGLIALCFLGTWKAAEITVWIIRQL